MPCDNSTINSVQILDELELAIVNSVQRIVARMTPEMRQRYSEALGQHLLKEKGVELAKPEQSG